MRYNGGSGMLLMSPSGLKADFTHSKNDVCFAPESGRRALIEHFIFRPT
jgi:hypothetical protein